MAYTQQYKKEDFLAVVDSTPKATTLIAKRVGCARNTAKKFLEELEAERKIKQVEIEGGFYAWVKVENELVIEGTIPEDGYIITEHPGKHFKLLIYRDEEKKEEKEQ